jgi:preprotein translocase subunit SecA
MEALREGIHLRSMAQKDPLVEYTGEGERMFTELGQVIRSEVVLHLFHAELAPGQEPPSQGGAGSTGPNGGPGGNGGLRYEHETSAGADVIDAALSGGVNTAGFGGAVAAASPQTVHASPNEKLGRNDPCWCGSGKKFKKCHGA